MCLGIPGQIIEFVDDQNYIARAKVSGVKRNVNATLLRGEIGPGDWVLIHVGFAMSKLDEREARETLKLLYEMGSVYQDELRSLENSQLD